MEKTQKTTTFETSIKGPDKPIITRRKHRVPWQRLALSTLGIIIIVGMWRWATFHLYSLPDHSIAAFNSITNNCFYVIASLVLFFVTGKILYDWKNATTSTIIDSAQHISEDIKEKIDSTNTNINIDAQFRTPQLIERYEDK